ncbi:RNA polymerase sigma factor [Aureliella helgolandensis]|uniref:ECF RNA polymerase sigma factor SigE n=1 Tax=Aureliella helgolandensis TaxID=2527968 RepID=A0A518G632_9BACT|nr:sigma-70 family RNA polymerase sigma factor [Aureliella helgolandensis]QDV24051.1 ECF RNA polymerase sigma factor SigE [Aureliella helgolandensis]
MAEFPETRVSLILRLSEPTDVQAWQEFSDIYTPALLAIAHRKGLQAADAEDVAQEILFGVARAVERFRPDASRAKFRTWLCRIAHNLIADFWAGRSKRPVSQALTDSWLDHLVSGEANAPDELMLGDLQAAIFRVAAKRVARRVANDTWQAFERTAIQRLEPSQVGTQLGMSLGSVYVARCRVLRLLRDEVEQLQKIYADFDTAEQWGEAAGADVGEFDELGLGESAFLDRGPEQ